LKNPATPAVIEISFIGYKTQEISIYEIPADVLTVYLTEDISFLDEVVVIGYGTQKKGNLTGATTVVKMEQALGDRPVNNIGATLQGAVPGLRITGSASPGDSKSFNIRGTTSINGSPGPLILVDNVEAQIDLINPEDVETVTVLKDAASSAIYGARAAFGVILITTKKAGKNAKITLNYNNSFAFEKVTNQLEQASVEQYVRAANEWNPGGGWAYSGQPYALWLEYINDYQSDPRAFEDKAKQNGDYFNARWGMYVPQSGSGAGKYFYLKNNEASNEIFANYGFQQKHNVSASGGSDKITYRLSFGYLDNNGPLKLSKDNYQRINVASYVSADIARWLSTAIDIRYSRGIRHTFETLSTYNSAIYQTNYFSFLPGADSWTPANDLDGDVFLTTAPLNYIIHGNPDEIRTENPRIFSRTLFTPFSGFQGVLEYTYDENVYDKKSYPASLLMRDDQMNSNPAADPAFRNDKSTVRYNSLNAYGSYELSLKELHNFKLMGGFSQEQRYYELLWASRKDIINTETPSITGATGEIQAGDNYTDFAIRSGFFRFNYNYDNKYLLEINGRYDGSSRFPKDTRFGFFPSASVGWQIAREAFMESTRSWLDEFKIRASWGEIGNQAIGDYQFLPEMAVVLRSNWTFNGIRPTTLDPPGMVRGNFTWERVATLEFGTDISMFKNRLQMVFGLYKRDTKGMLGPGIEFPASVGADAPLQNVADLTNKGWEIALSWKDRISNWNYSVGFNLWDNNTEITKYNNEAGLFGGSNYYVGQKLGEIWGYCFDRFYTVDDFEDTQSWTLKEGVATIRGVSPRPGDILWKNLSDGTGENEINDGQNNLEDPGDRVIIGNSTPRYQFGGNFSIGYKGVNLSTLLQGTGKRDYWLGGNITFPLIGTHSIASLYKYNADNYQQVADAAGGDYTLINPDAFYPRIYNQPGQNIVDSNNRVSDRYLYNASYLRVKNITMSYTFPHSLVNYVRLSNARLFLSGEDVFTFSNLPKGIDPERLSWGYPFYATWSFGVNITL